MHRMSSSPLQPTEIPAARQLPRWQRWLWIAAGGISLAIGLVGLFLPLLPTTPLVLLSAFCFSRGSERCERWLIEHRVFGPMVRNWRATRSVPLRAKQIATLMMAISSIGTACIVPLPWGLMPGVCCALVAVWLWRLPTAGAGRVP
jgi:uncharacterized membrane protein YbaN (DUF454 family)